MKAETIIEKITESIATKWLQSQANPGIYKILFDPDTDEVSVTETFSGDNSYIPGDNRITLAYADIRESLSKDVLGLDEDGDIIESDTYTTILDEAERRLTEAANDGDIELVAA